MSPSSWHAQVSKAVDTLVVALGDSQNKWLDATTKERVRAVLGQILAVPDGPAHSGRRRKQLEAPRGPRPAGLPRAPHADNHAIRRKPPVPLSRPQQPRKRLSTGSVPEGRKGATTAGSPEPMFRCSCGSPVKVSNRGRHARRCPKMAPASMSVLVLSQSRRKRSSTKRGPRGLVGSTPHIEAEVKTPTLDATIDYAHRYRENGRFGSHPMHDDFGDEGWA
jgi:hypothetical protein